MKNNSNGSLNPGKILKKTQTLEKHENEGNQKLKKKRDKHINVFVSTPGQNSNGTYGVKLKLRFSAVFTSMCSIEKLSRKTYSVQQAQERHKEIAGKSS